MDDPTAFLAGLDSSLADLDKPQVCDAEPGDFIVGVTEDHHVIVLCPRCQVGTYAQTLTHGYSIASAHLNGEDVPKAPQASGDPAPGRFKLRVGVWDRGTEDERWVFAADCPAGDGWGREVNSLRTAWHKACQHCEECHGREPWVPDTYRGKNART
jgi:hypothetical protein